MRRVRDRFVFGAALASVGLMSACASLGPSEPPTLEALLDHARVSHLSLKRTDEGLLTVPVSLNGRDAVPFLIDTGATRSVIFRDRLSGLDLHDDGEVRVHGMVGKRIVKSVRVDTLQLGVDGLADVSFAVLPPRTPGQGSAMAHGILGMDILGDYRLFVRQGTDALALIPGSLPAPVLPSDWGKVELEPNPWGLERRGLKYLSVRVNGKLAPALLDFGSDANIMNFAFADFPEVRQARRRLRESHDYHGAVEAFRPRLQVRGINFRAGSRVWNDEDFIVREFDSLDILGVDSRPFMIAGANLFADATFYLDFPADVLRMPKSDRQMELEGRRRPQTGSRVDTASASVTRVTPEARSR